jgi:glycosyltransferase involved in cell wall biosynthesis
MSRQIVNIAIPVRNEERTLMRCLTALAENSQREEIETYTFVCLNACTDNTKLVAERARRKYPHLRLKIMESEPGMVVAQSKIISEIRNSYPIIFIDADAVVTEGALSIVLEELEIHPRLKAVGGHPVPEETPHAGFFQKHFTRVLNARAFYPMSYIYKGSLSEEYHPYAGEGLPTVTKEFEKRSKTFFHGRFFCLQDKSA